jgi:hypothetical protein
MQKLVLLAATLAALALPAPSALAYPPWVLAIRDCASDGKLDGTYRPADLVKALQNVPSDGDEYTDCASAIRRALEGGSGKTGGPPPGGIVTASGAVAASPDDAAQLDTVIAAADAGDPAPAPSAGTHPAASDVALDGLDLAASPAYRVDTQLLAAVVIGGLAMIAAASVLRRRRRTG